ncbi:hypothetical protein DB35_18655 [Streptomyces abyssalis]|uniref:DUF742 domain-containing protein n=1 Tax=Streptomyces abyssalis TaxID=933944 RepID=A0A1E7JL62_9ACTN|nr:DUF742 domain-containing protein [Streptomyces abyssalis]OEU88355.1 hypothetical protein AN215_19805 [Streptomyces abyssalis]OEU91225.1 hypothetical protein DB35_18655 [Streptomyces abyssalis]OEV31810.1 hypothetical protein AN219_02800 [Streptomyces nanshensis]
MTHRHRHDLVRSFVLTGGRAQPTGTADELDLITMVTAVPGKPRTGLQPEHLRAIDLCRGGYLTVVEVAGHLGQPLTITRILLGDLIDSGLLSVKGDQGDQAGSGIGPAAGTPAGPEHLRTLERMLHGLQAL